MSADREEPRGLAADVADDAELEVWGGFGDGEPHSLVDLVNRVLDRGVVIAGEITISVAGVDLVYLGLNAVLTSISTARRSLAAPRASDAVGEGDNA